jgi:hypothetical protein
VKAGLAHYASLSSAPSAYPHVGYSSYLHTEDVNDSTDARFSTDDRSLSGDGIPNFKARITDLVTEVKDIKIDLKDTKTDLKDIKTEVKNMVYAFQTIQKETAIQTRQRKGVIDFVSNVIIGTFLIHVLVIGGMWIVLWIG